MPDSNSDLDSLFDEPISATPCIASRGTPPIPGLWIFPDILHHDIAHDALDAISEADHFAGGSRNQVMIFTSASTPLPPHLQTLLDRIQSALQPHLDPSTLHTTFNQPLSRQVILNLYPPGQGITPHIDLPHRYADGILGVSLIGSTVMTFTRGDQRYDVYIPARSVYVLSGEVRWEWKHGIEEWEEDLLEGEDGVETVLRGMRLSVTFRWMKEGGDVLQ